MVRHSFLGVGAHISVQSGDMDDLDTMKYLDREARDSARSIAKSIPEVVTLHEASMRLVEAWAKSESWSVAFGEFRRVVEREFPEEYRKRFKSAVNAVKKEKTKYKCGCGSLDVVAVTKAGNWCSQCLQKRHYNDG